MGRWSAQELLLLYSGQGRNPTIQQTSILSPPFHSVSTPEPCPNPTHVPRGQEEAAGSHCNAASGEGRGGRKERREGQRQMGPHVKGAGAGSYYLLGSRCPLASPGSAGSSAREHKGEVLEQAWGRGGQTHPHPEVHRCSQGRNTQTIPTQTYRAAANVRVFIKAPPISPPLCGPQGPHDFRIGDPGVLPLNFEQLRI